MKTTSSKNSIYIGQNAGTELINHIRNAKTSVKIVSPYLSPDYIKELINLNNRGIKITLITCDDIKENQYSDFKVSDIIKQKKIPDPNAENKKKTIKGISYLFLLISILTLSLSIFSLDLLIIPISLFLISMIGLTISYFTKKERYEYYSIFRLKVFDSNSGEKPLSKELIHSKIFVIDEKIAFLGSLNFTYSGFKTHYETLIKIEDINAVNDISKEVESLYESNFLKSKSIDELGKQIYTR